MYSHLGEGAHRAREGGDLVDLDLRLDHLERAFKRVELGRLVLPHRPRASLRSARACVRRAKRHAFPISVPHQVCSNPGLSPLPHRTFGMLTSQLQGVEWQHKKIMSVALNGDPRSPRKSKGKLHRGKLQGNWETAREESLKTVHIPILFPYLKRGNRKMDLCNEESVDTPPPKGPQKVACSPKLGSFFYITPSKP